MNITRHSDEDLYELVNSFYATDQLRMHSDPRALQTQKEQHAKALMTSTLKRKGDRFEIGLLWKQNVMQGFGAQK